ncbi:MAG: NAD+ synthase [Methanomicrobiales archaeon]|nr:NAD+ synthase [Methanomicrobiales archaeon]
MKCEIGCEIERIEQMIRNAVWQAGARGIVIGISGGIDSAVAAALCCGAVGAERVTGIALPSAVTAPEDLEHAALLARTLGFGLATVSIEPMLAGFRAMPDFVETPYLLGNLMARIRMATLYYHANRDGCLVCGTSNRSEFMIGYTTKFGDNAADIQPILHLYKTEVIELARSLAIPGPILDKPPSAGLWHGQTDEGEIGYDYASIDASLRSLEAHGWKPASAAETAILTKVKESVHKRMPAPHLL